MTFFPKWKIPLRISLHNFKFMFKINPFLFWSTAASLKVIPYLMIYLFPTIPKASPSNVKSQTHRYQLTHSESLCFCVCVRAERLISERAEVSEVRFRIGPHDSWGEGQWHGLPVVMKTSWRFSHQRALTHTWELRTSPRRREPTQIRRVHEEEADIHQCLGLSRRFFFFTFCLEVKLSRP